MHIVAFRHLRLEKVDYKVLITACNSSFSTTDSACACKKYELLMHVLANSHKGHFDYFCAFRRQHIYTILYRGHNNTTSFFNLFSACCLCEKAILSILICRLAPIQG